MGELRAQHAAEELIKKGVTRLLVFGVCGALSPALKAGDLILPKTVLSPDGTSYQADATWRDSFSNKLNCDLQVHTESLLHADEIIKDKTEKQLLFEKYNAIATDMESFAVARVATKADIPFLIVRAVSDPVDYFFPRIILNSLREDGRINPVKFALNLMRYPNEIGSLIQMGKYFKAAKKTLRSVLPLIEMCD